MFGIQKSWKVPILHSTLFWICIFISWSLLLLPRESWFSHAITSTTFPWTCGLLGYLERSLFLHDWMSARVSGTWPGIACTHPTHTWNPGVETIKEVHNVFVSTTNLCLKKTKKDRFSRLSKGINPDCHCCLYILSYFSNLNYCSGYLWNSFPLVAAFPARRKVFKADHYHFELFGCNFQTWTTI